MSLQTASPKTKVPMRLGTRVKGMQQTASIRSLSARESRKELVTVRRRRFRSSTATTRAFPQTLSTKISVYSRMRTVRSRSAGSRVMGCHAGIPAAPRHRQAAWLGGRTPVACRHPGTGGHVPGRFGGELAAGHPGSLRVAATPADVGLGCPLCPPARLCGRAASRAGLQCHDPPSWTGAGAGAPGLPCPALPGTSPQPHRQDVAGAWCPSPRGPRRPGT